MENSQKRPHYGALDTLRGLCVISMVLYHAMYDLVVPQGLSRPLVRGLARLPLAAEHLLDLYPPLGPVLESVPPPPAPGPAFRGLRGGDHPGHLAGYAQPAHPLRGAEPAGPLRPAAHPPGQGPAEAAPLAGACGWRGCCSSSPGECPGVTWGFEGLRLWDLPAALYQWDALAVLGFHSPGFSSTDYFPLLPWFFLYLAGYFLWRVLTPHRKVLELLQPGLRPPQLRGQAQPAHLPGPPAPADGPLLVPLKKFARAFAGHPCFFGDFPGLSCA